MSNQYDDIELNESNRISFDFNGLLFRILGYWPLILICVIAGLTVAYFINVRKQNIYRLIPKL